MLKDNMSEPLVSIVIVNYETGDILSECIRSIVGSDYKNVEIILVDNNSKDKGYRDVKKEFPQIVLIENEENLGYCGGNNVGIDRCGGEYVVILNPDTVVTPRWLHGLLAGYERFGDGLYQPKLVSHLHKDRINTAGNWIQVLGFGFSSGKGKKDQGNFDMEGRVGFASGACLFTKRNVIDKIGVFDDFLFAYHDDLELGWRAAKSGIKSYYVPSSVVYHAESLVFAWSKRKYFLLERNRWYCLLVHYSRRTLYKILPSLILVEIMMLGYYTSKGMIGEKIRGYASIIRNRGRIRQKYLEMEGRRSVPDTEIVEGFRDEMEAPAEVASEGTVRRFNGILGFLSRSSRRVI